MKCGTTSRTIALECAEFDLLATTRTNVMEGYLNIWLNVATVLALAGIAVWMTLLPSTTFFGDDD